MQRRKEKGEKLNKQQRAVIDAYFGPSRFCKTDALRRAGYRHPRSYLRLFEYPAVVAEVERRQERIKKKYDVTYERVRDEMARLAFSSIADFSEIDPDTGEFVLALERADLNQLAAIGEIKTETRWEGPPGAKEKVVEVRVKPYNKLAALEALGRFAGLSKEKVNVTGEIALVDRIRAARDRRYGKGEGDGEQAGDAGGADEGSRGGLGGAGGRGEEQVVRHALGDP